MGVVCLDCSYRSKKNIPGSRCPACGSLNLATEHAKQPQLPLKAGKPYRIALVIALWLYLLLLIMQKMTE